MSVKSGVSESVGSTRFWISSVGLREEMKTKFDHITDDEIATELALSVVLECSNVSPYPFAKSDVHRIAYLAAHMEYWQCWLGPPLTYHESEGLEFDGQHRCRAVKFLARRKGMMIQVPLRYSTRVKE